VTSVREADWWSQSGWICTAPRERDETLMTCSRLQGILTWKLIVRDHLDELRRGRMALGGRFQLTWAYEMRRRQSPSLDHGRLRWYRDATWTYRFMAEQLVPAILKPLAQFNVEGLEHVPLTGPVILAANHRDNLDAYLLVHLVPRMVHFAARPDAFGTGPLCAIWRQLGAFPADAWGMRHAVSLLSEGGVVAIFPQGRISEELGDANGAVGLLALRSGAPVVPVAITGTDAVHATCAFTKRASISVRFGAPTKFARNGPCSPRSQAVAVAILRQVGTLLDERQVPSVRVSSSPT
jgi:1-acyl-sn-glycerol-3-phosphate acyltransferase